MFLPLCLILLVGVISWGVKLSFGNGHKGFVYVKFSFDLMQFYTIGTFIEVKLETILFTGLLMYCRP